MSFVVSPDNQGFIYRPYLTQDEATNKDDLIIKNIIFDLLDRIITDDMETDYKCGTTTYKGYEFTLEAVKKVDKEKYLYVIQENDCKEHSDVHYFLCYYDNDILKLLWEIETYNPWFGCDVTKLHMITDDTVYIKYHEKHCVCEVKLKLETDDSKFHRFFLGSPLDLSKYARRHTNVEIGQVIEFIKEDHLHGRCVMPNNHY